eukprot:772021-Pleurochrysis_carterae.AAC.1
MAAREQNNKLGGRATWQLECKARSSSVYEPRKGSSVSGVLRGRDCRQVDRSRAGTKATQWHA